MREIKFRCWNKHWNEMYAWEIMCDDGLNNYMSEDDIWLQYTGLKDKNGHPLYDGDIINNEFFNMEIVWSDKHAAFECRRADGCPSFLCLWANECAYVGNRHEHPELLEDSK